MYLAEQEKTSKAIQSLQDNNHVGNVQPTSRKQLEFQDMFQIDFRNIDQNLPKSIRPVFSQDGFKIGKSYIEVDKERRLMQVQGKHNIYAITQGLVDFDFWKVMTQYI